MSTIRVRHSITTGLLGSALLVALQAAGAQAPGPDPIRTIDVTLSRYAFSPERIEVRVGEQVLLNVSSLDSAHGLEVKELRVNARVPARGRTVAMLTPRKAGTFPIACSEYCGTGHSRMKAWLIVTPAT